jgi:hypothetical protein
MVKYNIAVLNSKELSKEGFNKKISNDISLKNCITIAKDENAKYVAIEPDKSSTSSGINIQGKCYSSTTFNPLASSDAADGTYEVYLVPDAACKTDDCLQNSAKSALITEIKKIRKEIGEKKRVMDDINVKLFAMENKVTLSEASEKFKLQQQQAKIANEQKILNDKMTGLSGQLDALNTTSLNANMQLADKNRLLANVNTKIQQSYSKLGQVNSRINTTTQDIYQNNMEFERKNQIVTTLKAIIIILFIMMMIMATYYGVIYAQQNYPDSFEFVNNSLNKMGFGNNPFS